jgi:DNA-directed RNA polymerase subunit L
MLYKHSYLLLTMTTTKVKNIQEISHDIPEYVLKLCEELKVSKFVPTAVPKTLSFELHDTSTEIANAFRRCINNELDVLIMYFDDQDLICTDPFIIPREIQKTINLIPIKQISDITYSVDVYNNTNDIMYVMSSDIKENGESTEDKFSQSFIIAELNPGHTFKIISIKVKHGVGFKDGAAFSYPECVGYECLDIEGKDDIKSSLEVEPTRYRLKVQKQQYANPKHIVKRAAKLLEQKLDVINKLINDSETGSIRGSDKLEINKEKGDLTTYKIYNETYTIGHLIVKYITEVDPSIEVVSCFKEFTSHDYILLKVGHSDADALVRKAIARAKKEIAVIGSAF